VNRYRKNSPVSEIIAYGREFPTTIRAALAEIERGKLPATTKARKPSTARGAYLASIEEKLAREEMAEAIKGRRVA
jgi:hypothetical protein